METHKEICMRRPLHIFTVFRQPPHGISISTTTGDGEGASRNVMNEDDGATVVSAVEEESENGGASISKDHGKVIMPSSRLLQQ